MTTKEITNSQKYMTRGVQATISLDLQLILWQMIEDLKKQEEKIDYLQVFNLTTRIEKGGKLQDVQHIQEIPPHERKITVNTIQPVNEKIFVIVSKDEEGNLYSRMLLAEEYY